MVTKKDLTTYRKPRGEAPTCHDRPMWWNRYAGEWQCREQLAHWSRVITRVPL